jgi:heat shock protein HslJ
VVSVAGGEAVEIGLKDTLASSRWFVVGVDGSSWADAVVPSAEFGRDASLAGFDGCNTYSAPKWDLVGSTLSAPNAVATQLECADRPFWPSVQDGDTLVANGDSLVVNSNGHRISLASEASLEDPSGQSLFETNSHIISISLVTDTAQVGSCNFPIDVASRTLLPVAGQEALEHCVDRGQFKRGDSELVALLGSGEALRIGISPTGSLLVSSANGAVQIPAA